MTTRLQPYIALIIACLIFVSCTPKAGHSESDKPIIAVTIAPTSSVIRTLTGTDAVDILELLPEGATPESYEPSMQDMSRLSKATAWFYVGDLGFEQSWLSRIKELNPHLQLVRLDSGLRLIEGEEHIHADGSKHSSDPHYWMSIQGIKVMSENARLALGRILPEIDTSQGYDSIQSQLYALSNLAKSKSFSAPSFIIYHPSLAYFAQEQGLTQLVIEQDGKEPTVHHLRGLVERARRDGTKIMFFQKEFGAGAESSDYIKKEMNLQIIEINPFSENWFSELKKIIQALQS